MFYYFARDWLVLYLFSHVVLYTLWGVGECVVDLPELRDCNVEIVDCYKKGNIRLFARK